jgi:hypothetical protein
VFEPDQQIRRKPGELPEHEQRQDVVAEGDAEHRSHERKERGIEPAGSSVTVEVAACVENDKGADAGDQRREQEAQAVQVERERQSKRRRPGQLDQAAARGNGFPQFVGKEDGEQRGPGGQHPRSTGNAAGHPAGGERDDERRQDQGDEH